MRRLPAAVFFVVFCLVTAVAGVIYMPHTAFAGGGVGGGGSGGGGTSGGPWGWTTYGHGWKQYDVDSKGPSAGFHDGNLWPSIQKTCKDANAGAVMVYVLGTGYTSSGTGTGKEMGYDYQTSYGDSSAGYIKDATAHNEFKSLPDYGVSIAGYRWGDNVGWFCWNIATNWKLSASAQINGTTGSINVKPGATVKFSFSVDKTGKADGESTVKETWTSGNSGNIQVWKNRTFGSDFSDNYSFTIPANAPNGRQYCARVTADPKANDNNATETSNTVCAVVTISDPNVTVCQKSTYTIITIKQSQYNANKSAYILNPGPGACQAPVPLSSVTLTPHVTATSFDDVEPTETVMYTSYVYVSGFPSSRTQWGYTEVAKIADPHAVGPSVTSWSYGSSNTKKTGTGTNTPYCTHYKTTSPYNCDKWSCTGTGCNYTYTYYSHTCKTYSFTDYSSSGTCTDGRYWVCPSPSSTTKVGYANDAAPACHTWHCAYADGPNYISGSSNGKPNSCVPRCSAGTGPASDLYGNPGGDLNCYKQPSFSLTCQWDDGSTVTVTVTGDGQACQSTAQRVAGAIGTFVCATYSPWTPAGWSSPPPGWGSTGGGSFGEKRRYVFVIGQPSPAQSCVRVVGKPIVKVAGGDVAVGGTFSPCTTNSGASIVAWPGYSPDYSGAGTTLAAFAPGNIRGFATAVGGSPVTAPPGGLAFSNTSVAGEVYGGHYTVMPCIANYWANKSSVAVATPTATAAIAGTANGSFTVSGTQQIATGGGITVQRGGHRTIYVDGNLLITGSGIYYNRSGWTSIDDIPALEVVVRGNIYISSEVSELNGVYVAQPTSPLNGKIYTCASGYSPVAATARYDQCNNQLTVNGAFIAQQVEFDRASGTRRFGTVAEQFNYLPELWLGQWPVDNSATKVKYDSVLSLPPTL